MAERSLGQLSLADSLVAGKGRNEALDRLGDLIDWSMIARLLSPVWGAVLPGGGDVQGVAAAAMARIVGPRPALEASIEDRLSFRRFCAFALDAETPDHVTIYRFPGAVELAETAVAIAVRIDDEMLLPRQLQPYPWPAQLAVHHRPVRPRPTILGRRRRRWVGAPRLVRQALRRRPAEPRTPRAPDANPGGRRVHAEAGGDLPLGHGGRRQPHRVAEYANRRASSNYPTDVTKKPANSGRRGDWGRAVGGLARLFGCRRQFPEEFLGRPVASVGLHHREVLCRRVELFLGEAGRLAFRDDLTYGALAMG
jgi:Transposase domain (DUF772)